MSDDTHPCADCGEPYFERMGSYWLASYDLWAEVVGTDQIALCPSCFGSLAQFLGTTFHWEAVRDNPTEEVTMEAARKDPVTAHQEGYAAGVREVIDRLRGPENTTCTDPPYEERGRVVIDRLSAAAWVEDEFAAILIDRPVTQLSAYEVGVLCDALEDIDPDDPVARAGLHKRLRACWNDLPRDVRYDAEAQRP